MTLSSNSSHIEFVRHEKLHHVSVFVVNMLYRNMHEHSDFEINCILEGKAKIRHRDVEFIAQKGDFLVTNPYEAHEIRSCDTNPVQILCVQLSKHFCEEYAVVLKSVIFRNANLREVLSREESDELKALLFAFCETYWAEETGFQLECVAQLCLMMSWLLKHVPHDEIEEKAFDQRRTKHSRARRMREYVDQHYRERITLDTLAEAEGLSRTYVSHFFHDNLNVTFQDYLNQVRLEQAIQLVLDTDLPITDICMESGFSDNKYLNQMLKREFGCNATRFREIYGETGMLARSRGEENTSSQHILSPEQSRQVLKRHLQQSEQ